MAQLPWKPAREPVPPEVRPDGLELPWSQRVAARVLSHRSGGGQLLEVVRSASAVDRWLRKYHGEEWDQLRGIEEPPAVAPEPEPVRGWARGLGPKEPARRSLVTASNNVSATRSGAARRAQLEGLGLDPARLRETVAVALGTSQKREQERSARRERYRLRRAHQLFVDVEQYAGRETVEHNELREVEELRERVDRETGEVSRELVRVQRWVRVTAPKPKHRQLSQVLCGRAPAVTVPEKGAGVGLAGVGKRAAVDVRRRPDGRAGASGLYYCGNVWSCPVCSWHIARERTEEVQRVYDYLCTGPGPKLSAYFLTLTVRHTKLDALAKTRGAVADMWRRIRGTRGWKSWMERLGYYGDVRALEVTTGANGWHPHLHIVLFALRPIPKELGDEFCAWLLEQWQARCGRELGKAPDERHGLQLERVRSRADYVAKLGIAAELSGTHAKEARKEGSRTTWQLLRDLSDQLEENPTAADTAADVGRWREWVDGMHGARQLTWGGRLRGPDGVRAQLGEVELTDEELLRQSVERGELVASVPVELWVRLDGKTPGFAAGILEAAESGGGQAVELLVHRLERWWAGEETEGRKPERPPLWWTDPKAWALSLRKAAGNAD